MIENMCLKENGIPPMIRKEPVQFPVRGSDETDKEMEWRSYSNYLKNREFFLKRGPKNELTKRKQLRKKEKKK